VEEMETISSCQIFYLLSFQIWLNLSYPASVIFYIYKKAKKKKLKQGRLFVLIKNFSSFHFPQPLPSSTEKQTSV
jgi:hypothetical protein